MESEDFCLVERVHLTAFGRVHRATALAHLPSPTETEFRTGSNKLLLPSVTVALAGNLTLSRSIFLGFC